MKNPKSLTWTMLGVIIGLNVAFSFLFPDGMIEVFLMTIIYAIIVEYIGLRNLVIFEISLDITVTIQSFKNPSVHFAIVMLQNQLKTSYIHSAFITYLIFIAVAWFFFSVSLYLNAYLHQIKFFDRIGFRT